jgi:hypothetical protein
VAGDEITLAEVIRSLVRIETSLEKFVMRVEHDALKQRVDDVEEDRKSLVRMVGGAVIGVIATAIMFALQLKGVSP